MTERPAAAGRVTVVGSINIDHVVVAAKFPSPGETILGQQALVTLGGKGANQAVAAALAGARVTMIGRVGADAEGERARAGMARHGVDTSGVAVVDGVDTGTAWITVAEQDNTIIVVSGANHRWPDSGNPLAGTPGSEDDVVLAQLEIPFGVVTRAAEACRGRFLLNAAPAAELPDELIARCAVLIVNEHEQAVVAGLPEEDGIEAAHRRLRERGAGAVVTTLGPAGAVITDFDGSTARVPAIPAPEVVDTTGAGDAFAGVLAARLAAGDPLREAARWASAAGSLAVRAPGAQESYPDRETLRRTVLGSPC
ncbi:ribokinase [Pseudonocardia eucalypti]|uniref:PfkB family carbohydrate kinase n=1 Tax=Pseudonocardia eucalypti TaxID=648755 RepID=UPI001610C93A|nr:ribokinase [Pseudonocardia eucalypti]